MKVEIKKGTPRGAVAAPPSKSCAHRMIICAALADGVSRIAGVGMSEDILATLDCVRALGAEARSEGGELVIRGCKDKIFVRSDPRTVLRCRESGSTLRFMIPVALCGGGAVFCGTERLVSRGVGVYEDILRPRGIEFSVGKTEIGVSGRLSPGEYSIPGGVSSQFISGMLFALPMLGGNSTVNVIPPFESRSYVDITVAAQRRFGVAVERTGENGFFIRGGQSYRPADVTVEGDWSQAAFFYALEADGGAGTVTVTGLDPDSLQGDRVCVGLLRQIRRGYTEADLSDCPDLAPVLFAAAAASGHGARFSGTRRLAIKESRRADVMAEELRKFGADVRVDENSVTVAPGELCAPQVPLCGHNDHRVVMALSVLAARTGGVIEGAEAVKKSYPGFFDDLASLGLEVQCYGT